MALIRNSALRLSCCIQAVANASIAFGSTLLLGWLLNLNAVARLHPSLVSIEVDAALCFLLFGLSMRSRARERHFRGYAFFLLAIPLLTLVEYVTELPLGVEGLLLTSRLITDPSYVGTMAPSTALCFLMVGAAFLLRVRLHESWLRAALIIFLGWAVVGLALLSLFGYAAQYEAGYGWVNYTTMAVHTACGLLLCGIGTTIYGREIRSALSLSVDELRRSVIFYSTGSVVFVSAFTALLALLPLHERVRAAARSTLEHRFEVFSEAFDEELLRYIRRTRRLSTRADSEALVREALEGKAPPEEFTKHTTNNFLALLREHPEIVGAERHVFAAVPRVQVGEPVPGDKRPRILDSVNHARLGAPHLSEQEGMPRIVLSSPLFSPQYELIGVDYFLISLEPLARGALQLADISESAEIYALYELGEKNAALHIDGRGFVSVLERAHPFPDATIKHMLLNRHTHLEKDGTAARSTSALFLQKTPRSDWHLLLSIDSNELYSAADRHSTVVLASLLIFSVVSGLGMYQLMRPFSGKLVLKTEELGERMREATAVIARQREQFSSAFANAPIGLALVSSEGLLQEVNYTFCAMLHCGEEDILGERWESLLHPESAADVTKALALLEQGVQRTVRVDAKLSSSNVEAVFVQLDAASLVDSFGQIRQYVIHVQDIGQRIRSEQLLREGEEQLRVSEARMKLALVGGEMGTWDWDLLTNEVVFNETQVRLLGIGQEAQQTDAERFFERVHPEDRAMLESQLARVFKQEIDYDEEFRILRPSGEVRWLVARGRVLYGKDGTPLRMIGVNYDVTEKKQREQELRRSNEELEQFAYIACHDLKAPLRAVKNCATWIAEDALDVLPEESREHLSRMRERVGAMEKLLDDLLDYSRVGRSAGARSDIETKILVSDIVKFLEPAPHVRMVVEEQLPSVCSDRVPLEQVFRNLIENALKYCDAEDPLIKVYGQSHADYCQFFVADNGSGIAKELHEKAFRMFQTLHLREEGKSGSGMGLAVVKKLVEQRGGTVGIDSEPGAGTVFRFTWPRNS